MLFLVCITPCLLACTGTGRSTLTLHGAISTRRFSENFNYTNNFNPSYQTESSVTGGFLSNLIGTIFKPPLSHPKMSLVKKWDFFCAWHKNGGRHVLTAGVLEIPCGSFHYISHQKTAHFHTAKGYIIVSAEAE